MTHSTAPYNRVGTLLALILAASALTGCFVDFDIASEGPFICESDADCSGDRLCIKGGGSTGVCTIPETVVPKCIDLDGDGYGEGDPCDGPDCDDNDPNVYPGAPELCDGKDNNCECVDGGEACAITVEMVDEPTVCTTNDDCGFQPRNADNDTTIANRGVRCHIEDGGTEGVCVYRCPNDTIGVCKDAASECAPVDNGDGTFTPTLTECDYGPNFLEVSEAEEPCDMMDNNCNGTVDGGDQCAACDADNPKVCSNNFGICRAGVRMCTDDGFPGECVDADTGEVVPEPIEETCNGVDDDCDGVVDNMQLGAPAGSVCDDGCPFGMVLVADPNGTPPNNTFCVDRWEASRPDATVDDAGTDASRAVTQANVLPWTSLSATDARNACRGTGSLQYARKELCSPLQLQIACMAGMSFMYPYGDTYDGASCNGMDAGVGTVAATGSNAACVTPDVDGRPGLFDLTGNVAEITLDSTLNPQLIGGSFQSDMANLTCSTEANGQGEVGPQVGFRCCTDPVN